MTQPPQFEPPQPPPTPELPLTPEPSLADGPPPPAASRQLIRPDQGRIVGGVCAGLAEMLNVDVLLVRVGFVLLATIGGAGMVAYLALWLLTPSVGRQARVRPTPGRSVRSLILLALLASLAIGLAGGVGHDAGLAWVLLAALAVAALAGRRRLLVLGLVLLLGAGAVGTVAAAGSAFSSRSYTVSNPDDLQSDYHLAAGTLRLDLTGLQLTGERTVTARVGSGDLIVRVPATLAVRVHARAGVGGVHVLGRNLTGIAPQQARDGGPSGGINPGSRLVLDLAVGTGSVSVQAGS